VHDKYLLPNIFTSYFIISNTYSHDTRIRENLHLNFVSKILEIRSPVWNHLPTSLKGFYTVKKFNTKSKQFLQSADIDSIVLSQAAR